MALYSREYTTPFLLDIAIKNCILADFVAEIIDFENERFLWGVYNSHQLALYGVDFKDFKGDVVGYEDVETPIENVIAKNIAIMDKFKPKEV